MPEELAIMASSFFVAISMLQFFLKIIVHLSFGRAIVVNEDA